MSEREQVMSEREQVISIIETMPDYQISALLTFFHAFGVLSEAEREMIARARLTPITFDEDCPETTPEKAVQFRRVNPVRKAAN